MIEGDYTFNASPDYSAEQTPVAISAPVEESSIPAGGILLGALILVFIGGIATRALNRKQ